MQRTNKWNVVIQNKTRQQAETQKQNNILKQKTSKTERKNDEPDTEMRNRKEGIKKRTRERQRKRQLRRGEAPKRLKRNKGRHRKTTQKKMPFF